MLQLQVQDTTPRYNRVFAKVVIAEYSGTVLIPATQEAEGEE